MNDAKEWTVRLCVHHNSILKHYFIIIDDYNVEVHMMPMRAGYFQPVGFTNLKHYNVIESKKLCSECYDKFNARLKVVYSDEFKFKLFPLVNCESINYFIFYGYPPVGFQQLLLTFSTVLLLAGSFVFFDYFLTLSGLLLLLLNFYYIYRNLRKETSHCYCSHLRYRGGSPPTGPGPWTKTPKTWTKTRL